MDITLSKNYREIFQLLKDKIKSARLRTTIAVNKELLAVYWEIGDTINKQELLQGWGIKTIEKLAEGNTATRIIALKMGRTEDSIQSKASAENISLKPINQSPYYRKK